jgi:hypothetical protein|tara:strand:+ start:64 stop:243 length:180 start_codon:yes stop_codon:yes gene_type:complete
MGDFKKFWSLVKDWTDADSPSKHTAGDIINWIDDYIDDPEKTIGDIKHLKKRYEKDIQK